MENPDFPTSLARGRGDTAGDGEQCCEQCRKKESAPRCALFLRGAIIRLI